MKTESYVHKGQDSQTTTNSVVRGKDIKSNNHLCSLEKPPTDLTSGLLLEIQGSTFLYKKWPGKNYFLLKGRIMFGPNPKNFMLTLLCFIVLWISYFVLVLPESYGKEMILISICAIIFAFFSFLSLLFGSFDDPGIIPRKEILYLIEGYENYLNFMDPVEKKNEETKIGNARNYFLNGKMIMIKNKDTPQYFNFCNVCKIHKPPLTKHCKVCDNCVETHDFHSFLFNNCIGKKNYRFYISFWVNLICFLLIYIYEIFHYFFIYRSPKANVITFDQNLLSYVIFGIVVLPLTLTTLIFSTIFYSYFKTMELGLKKKQQGINFENLGKHDWFFFKPSNLNARAKILDSKSKSPCLV